MKRYPITDVMEARLEADFTYAPPKPDQPERYTNLRAKARELAEMILTHTPKSREQSVAITTLSEVIMWSNAAIARNEVAE